jgi:hypothetical protein
MLYGVQVTDKLYHIMLYGVQVTDKLYHIMLYGVQVTDKLYNIMLYGVQVVPIITDVWVRISIRARCTTICDKVCQWLATGWWFSPGIPVSSTNKTDCHDITEILLNLYDHGHDVPFLNKSVTTQDEQ